MTSPSPEKSGNAHHLAYSHLPTYLTSPTHPIALRTMELSDAKPWSSILADPRNTEFEGDEVPTEMEHSKAVDILTRQRESAAQPTVVDARTGKVIRGPSRVNMVILFCPTDNDDDDGGPTQQVIGLGGFGSLKDLGVEEKTAVPKEDREGKSRGPGTYLRVGDVGAMVNYEYRRRGFAVEAIRMAMEWGFRKASEGGLQLDKITSTTLLDNRPMVDLLEKKMGWKGTKRVAEELWEGKDEMFYEMTVEEWEARK
ncbi:uncharacterized protein BCR38DRAFT_344380 [Pseudomassariella vexata]|uniref:N-acetyltransferase domain-containing protein n=1 Tax=Pseudomassariella vexata TaxID=1141098 RepID=A0A1Y2DUE8_9PEZI|nr:uncharacterized protein BCR38DRAFT_344380 [Pseudomassariella vexata]ORY62922.1 hypothetical protein BCR38DRAFT_344380 [Pseudomassariella vexata]